MDAVTWMGVVDQGVAFLLLIVLSIILYRGLKKNHGLLSEREELLKRYILYRGDKQVHLRIYGEDEKIHQELLKTISTSWKKFKSLYDRCLSSFLKNTTRTRQLLQIITLGLLINTLRLLAAEVLSFGFRIQIVHSLMRELSIYVPVVLSFVLLRAQTRRFLTNTAETGKVERDILFFPTGFFGTTGYQGLYDEFDPLEETGAEDGREDSNDRGRIEG